MEGDTYSLLCTRQVGLYGVCCSAESDSVFFEDAIVGTLLFLPIVKNLISLQEESFLQL